MDTIYYRYDHTVGSKTLSNYYKVKPTKNTDIYTVEEFYRFTKNPEIKASYTENKEGEKEGSYIAYTKDGLVKEQGTYKNDVKEGFWIYYEEGKVQRKVFYKNDTLQGKAYYYADEKELYEWNWKDGNSEGYNESKYPNGTTRFKGTYVNGESEGASQSFYDNGQLSVDRNYKNGKLEGPYEMYYDDGQLKSKGHYVDGKEIGEWVWYREDGQVSSKEVYNNKGKIKSLFLYNEDGQAIKSSNKDVFEGVIEEKKQLQKIIIKHVRDNFDFPDRMSRRGFESKVYVDFVINTSGEADRIKMSSEGPVIFEEIAEKIIASIPTQKPATAHNMDVNVAFRIPITFRIED